jgi:large subunit ribosomal protein L29
VKARELREKSSEELAENLSEAKKRLFFQMKMQRVTGEGAKPHEVRQIRRDIARIKTILRERQLAGSAGAGAKAETGAKS